MVQGAYAIHADHNQQCQTLSFTTCRQPHKSDLSEGSGGWKLCRAQDPIAVGNMLTLNGLTRAIVGPTPQRPNVNAMGFPQLSCTGVSSGRLLINNFGIDVVSGSCIGLTCRSLSTVSGDRIILLQKGVVGSRCGS